MEKVLLLDVTSLKKVALIASIAIMLLSLSSCVALMDALLGNSTCIEPGCDRDTSGHSSYCIIHSEKEPVEIDTKNPYNLHKPLSEEEMKTKVKINRRNY